MQTSLARRQRHRRALGQQPRGRNGSRALGAVSAIVVALFVASFLVAGLGLIFVVGAYNHYAAGLPDPAEQLKAIQFTQQTIVYDRTGKVELARLGDLKREVVTYADLTPEIIDATTSIEDKDFWTNPGFDPAASSRPASTRSAARHAARRRSPSSSSGRSCCRRPPSRARPTSARSARSSSRSG